MPRRILTIASLLSLAACGGGGGSGRSSGGGSPPPPPPPPASYRVSGTVTGLAAPVALSVNGAALTVSANGALTLIPSLTAGSPYTVTVTTQPTSPAQVCSITNGSGTANADVTNVAIDCVTTPLALVNSAPVEGAIDVPRTDVMTLTFTAALDAATATGAVTLRDGARDVATTVSVSGATLSVTPAATLPRAAPLVLTVATTLRGAHGEPVAQPVALRFTTRDGTWSAPVELDSGPTSNPGPPALGADRDGRFIAAWNEGSMTGPVAVSSRFVPGTGWSKLTTLNTGGWFAQDPSLAVSPNGAAVVVFRQRDVFGSGASQTIGRIFEPATGWAPLTILQSFGSGATDGFQTAINADGVASIAWLQSGIPTALRYVPGMGWNTPTTLTAISGTNVTASLVVDAAGSVYLGFDQELSTRRYVAVRRYSASDLAWGTIEVPDGLSTSVGAPAATWPRLAVDEQGIVTAVWLQDSKVSVSRRSVAGDWTSPVVFDTGLDTAQDPNVAVAPDGTVMVVWVRNDNGNYGIWFNRFANGAWESPREARPDGTVVSSPRVAFDGRGRAQALWIQWDGAIQHVRSSRFDPANGWSAPRTLDRTNATVPKYATLAVSPDGSAMALWLEGTSSANTLWASRFD